MKDEVIFLYLKDYFRKAEQTNFGKNQIIKILDNIEIKLRNKK